MQQSAINLTTKQLASDDANQLAISTTKIAHYNNKTKCRSVSQSADLCSIYIRLE